MTKQFYENYWIGQDNYLSDFNLKWSKLKKFIPTNDNITIVDFGCGNGKILEIIRKIKENIYGECSCNGKLEAIVANKTDLIQVKIKTKNSEIAKLFLNNLGSYIVFNHNKIIDQEKSFIDERIKKIEKEINLWENGKKLFDVNIIDSTYRLGSFFTKSKIEDKKREIEDLQFSLLGINETKIIKESNIIIDSRINKILLNIIIFGLIGLFFGIFLVFGKQLII